MYMRIYDAVVFDNEQCLGGVKCTSRHCGKDLIHGIIILFRQLYLINYTVFKHLMYIAMV